MSDNEEYERAVLESAALERALSKVHCGSTVETTPESIQAGEASIAAAYAQAPAQFQERVDKGELLTAEEFCDALGVDVDWLDDALRDGRVFALPSPDGVRFFPAFYADASLRRTDVERVAKVLWPLEPVARFMFFYRVWTPLRTSALEAMRNGRVEEVVELAHGYLEEASENSFVNNAGDSKRLP